MSGNRSKKMRKYARHAMRETAIVAVAKAFRRKPDVLSLLETPLICQG